MPRYFGDGERTRTFAENGTTKNSSGISYNPGEQGVFAPHPASTPKYNLFRPRDAEYRDSLARMFISLAGASTEVVDRYLSAIADPSARKLAEVLVGRTTSPQGGTGLVDFFLQQVNEQFSEKAQISEVIADHYVAFFFGTAPPIFTFSGTLLNSLQDDQRIGMAIAYQHLIRGTSCAQLGSVVRLRYDSVIVTGTILSMAQTLNADNELAVPFSMQMLVKEYLVVNPPVRIASRVGASTFDEGVTLSSPGITSDLRVRTSTFVVAAGEEGDGSGTPFDKVVAGAQDAENDAVNAFGQGVRGLVGRILSPGPLPLMNAFGIIPTA